jgi:hypothetical protein
MTQLSLEQIEKDVAAAGLIFDEAMLANAPMRVHPLTGDHVQDLWKAMNTAWTAAELYDDSICGWSMPWLNGPANTKDWYDSVTFGIPPDRVPLLLELIQFWRPDSDRYSRPEGSEFTYQPSDTALLLAAWASKSVEVLNRLFDALQSPLRSSCLQVFNSLLVNNLTKEQGITESNWRRLLDAFQQDISKEDRELLRAMTFFAPPDIQHEYGGRFE